MVKSDNPVIKNVVCQFCSKTVHLQLAGGPAALPAWRMYDCPHCHRTNFILLDAQIQAAQPQHE